MLALRVEIAVLTSVELDHHDASARCHELEDDYRAFLAAAPQAVDLGSPGAARAAQRARSSPTTPPSVELTAGGSRFALRRHRRRAVGARRAQRAQRRRGARGRAARGRRRRGGGAGPRALRRHRAPLRAPRRDRVGCRASTTTTRTTRPRSRRRSRPRATLAPRAAASPSSSPTSTRARRRSPASSAPRSRRADAVVVLDVYAAREQAAATSPGSAGCASPRRPPTPRAVGRPTGSRSATQRAPRSPRSPARATRRGDGRGRCRRARPRAGAGAAMVEPEANAPLARLTTVRTGGAAECFARAASRGGARRRSSPGRASAALESTSSGRARTCSSPTAACAGSCSSSRASWRGSSATATGCAAAAARGCRRSPRARRALGLGGIEFARQHPGHRRRRGADERQRLRRRARRRARLGRDRRPPTASSAGARPTSSASPTAAPALRRRRDRRARALRARAAPPRAVRATIASMRERRHAAQPKGIRTFGSTFKNPPGDDRRRSCSPPPGAAELAVGGARFSRKHANFVENIGGATTADILALMAAGRARVRERFGIELEPEVQLLGEIASPGSGSALAERESDRARTLPLRVTVVAAIGCSWRSVAGLGGWLLLATAACRPAGHDRRPLGRRLAGALEDALDAAARSQTTTDFSRRRVRAAVARYTLVTASARETHVPHGVTLYVSERQPVARLSVERHTVPLDADGSGDHRLPASAARGHASTLDASAGRRSHAATRSSLVALRVLRARPGAAAPPRRRGHGSADERLTIYLHRGPRLIFGNARCRTPSGMRPRRCSPIPARAARPTSTCGCRRGRPRRSPTRDDSPRAPRRADRRRPGDRATVLTLRRSGPQAQPELQCRLALSGPLSGPGRGFGDLQRKLR